MLAMEVEVFFAALFIVLILFLVVPSFVVGSSGDVNEDLLVDEMVWEIQVFLSYRF